MSETQHTPEAIALAESVMNAAGTALRHYMPYTKEAILAAAQQGIENAQRDLLEALEEAVRTIRAFESMGERDMEKREASWELYQHSPEMKMINAAIAKAKGGAA